MQELFKAYYRETERTTDMIYLATNFHVIVDPSITYYADDEATHLMWNNTYSDDEDLYWRAENMRKTEPGDIYDYVSKWVSFQERYNEVLPTIPVYSNIYFDFYVNCRIIISRRMSPGRRRSWNPTGEKILWRK